MRHATQLPCFLALAITLPAVIPGTTRAATPAKRWNAPAFALQIGDADPVGAAALRTAVAAAAKAWSAVGAGPEIQLRDAPAPSAAKLDGVNAVFFVTDRWPSRPEKLALTYAHVDARTREILEVDIALNAAHHRFATEESSRAFDLQNVLTHELGHALGLSHNQEAPEATMFPRIRAGERDKRDLAPPDESALLSLYEDLPDAGPAYGCSALTASSAPCLLALLLPLAVLPRRPRRA